VTAASKTFDALLFDLGGVLYDIEVSRTVDAFSKLGLQNFKQLYNLKEQTSLFDRLEIGQVDDLGFEQALIQHFDEHPGDGTIVKAWQALLIGMPEKNLTLLKELKKQYRLYLLSNTNVMHMAVIDRQIPELRELFDKTYLSYEIGLRKPDAEYYDYVIRDAGLDPQKSLFLDDNKDNVEGARKSGIHAVQVERGTDLRENLIAAGIAI
jgi:glucose-1-phosphatase